MTKVWDPGRQRDISSHLTDLAQGRVKYGISHLTYLDTFGFDIIREGNPVLCNQPGMFSLIGNRFGDAFISWVSMYSKAHLSSFMYLWCPKTKKTTYVYDPFFGLVISRNETVIDQNMLELRNRGREMFFYWKRAGSNGQMRICHILQYLASQSTLPYPIQQQRQNSLIRPHVYTLSLLIRLSSNLKDKVLFEGGSIVTNKADQTKWIGLRNWLRMAKIWGFTGMPSYPPIYWADPATTPIPRFYNPDDIQTPVQQQPDNPPAQPLTPIPSDPISNHSSNFFSNLPDLSNIDVVDFAEIYPSSTGALTIREGNPPKKRAKTMVEGKGKGKAVMVNEDTSSKSDSDENWVPSDILKGECAEGKKNKK
ncbi:hva22-like protein i [Nicotiana attenuata]|uniref:Hva22-like protein i n=1 Tax=Nicotiana attenuata TaxID=49451 RepID=A0A314KZR5_NICAT|nr:hva22-like protein i [Nicotiana attenuata]